jgi:hypothetical protein
VHWRPWEEVKTHEEARFWAVRFGIWVLLK